MDLLTVSRIYHLGGTLLTLRAAALALALLLAMVLRWKAGGRVRAVGPIARLAQAGTAIAGLVLAGWLVAVELLVFRAGDPLCLLAALALLAAFALGLKAPGWKTVAAVLGLAAAGLGYLLPFGSVPRISLLAAPAPGLDLESLARLQGEGGLLLQAFGDFQCPACAQMDRTLEQFGERHPGQIQQVYRHLPLTSIHPWAERAAMLSECAARQGRFREVKRDLFERQADLPAVLRRGYEDSWNLPDPRAFRTCVETRQTAAAVAEDVAEARRLGLRSTPSVLFGQTLVVGAVPLSRLSAILELARHPLRGTPASGGATTVPDECGSALSGGDCSAPAIEGPRAGQGAGRRLLDRLQVRDEARLQRLARRARREGAGQEPERAAHLERGAPEDGRPALRPGTARHQR